MINFYYSALKALSGSAKELRTYSSFRKHGKHTHNDDARSYFTNKIFIHFFFSFFLIFLGFSQATNRVKPCFELSSNAYLTKYKASFATASAHCCVTDSLKLRHFQDISSLNFMLLLREKYFVFFCCNRETMN